MPSAFARCLICVVVLACAAGNLRAASEMSPGPLDPADAAAFHTYLAAQDLSSRWTGDPTPLASRELATAYPGLRFLYTFKPAPPPPGAPMPAILEAHKRALEEYRAHSLRLTIGIDSNKNVHPFRTAADFNYGLRPVRNDDDARIAAAAILSLLGTERVSPGPVSASDMNVTKTESGWACHVSQKPRGIQGTVVFSASGECLSVDKSVNYPIQVPS